MSCYWRAIPSLDPARPTGALPIAGGSAWFDHVECLSRDAAPTIVPVAEAPSQILHKIQAPRADLAGLSLDRPRLMGILNTTPDSFSDGGRFSGLEAAVDHVRKMQAEGADLIDIGGESTRPGAEEVPVAEEIARTAPVIDALRGSGTILSLDTRKAAVAEAGMAAGAAILNDVSGLRFDPRLAEVAAKAGADLILMHSIATPETMQAEAATAYDNVLLDVYDGLAAAIARAEAAGVARRKIVVDPGIGFGKTQAQNLALIQRISLFHSLGCAILLGVSRKGFIGTLGAEPQADRRGPGSAGVGLWALGQGVQVLRVHDIALHKQAVALWSAAHSAL
ncbi:dihydropteroate synthase [Gymnodinialimonas sp.]